MIRNERGIFIIACLWICVLLIWLGIGISTLYKYRFHDKALPSLRVLGFYASLGGIYETIARMTNVDTGLEESREEAWKPDGNLHTISYGKCKVFVKAEEEDGKVNVNLVSSEELKKILTEKLNLEEERASQLADIITDFIDEDDFVRTKGAEKTYYESLGLSYGPANSKIKSLETLLLVPGVNWEIFWGVENFFPSQNSLFSLLTTYGSKTSLVESPGEKPLWKPGGLYRILSGSSCGGIRKVLVYAIVSYHPGQNPYYRIELLKEIF